jgi:tripartite-type tricarboxylate transporter receptor subunit TctC
MQRLRRQFLRLGAGAAALPALSRAPGDGYTIGIGHWSTHVVNGAIYPLPYDLLQAFAPIALLPSNPMLLVSRKSLRAKDLDELITWIKANTSAKIAAAGVGSGSHIAGLYSRI